MDSKILLAGAAGALAIAGVALAQDQTPSNSSPSNTPATSPANSASSYGADTSGTAADQSTAVNRAGERG
jgi:hypothetical protein